MNLMSEIFNDAFWYMAPILVTCSTFVSGLINQWFKIPTGWKQPTSWVTSAIVSCVAIVAGFLGEGITWPSYVAMSIVVALSANGIYDIKIIKQWIKTWFEAKV